MDLKELVKSPCDLQCMKSGGIAVYVISAPSGQYLFQIDLSDRQDVGMDATFELRYEKSLTLMRWIRRAIEDETIIKIA